MPFYSYIHWDQPRKFANFALVLFVPFTNRGSTQLHSEVADSTANSPRRV